MVPRKTAPFSTAKLSCERVMSARVRFAPDRLPPRKVVRQTCSMKPDLLFGAQTESVRSAPEKSEPEKSPKNFTRLSEAPFRLGYSRRRGVSPENVVKAAS